MAIALFEHGSILTTTERAKALRPYAEKLITRAKKADLQARKMLIAELASEDSAKRLIEGIVPKLVARTSGYLRITASENRKGDNAAMSNISFVDDLKSAPATVKAEVAAPPKPTTKTAVKAKPATAKPKKPVAKKETK